MKKAVLLALCLSSLFAIGCAPQMASLSKGVPESFYADARIEFDESKSVSYTFESKLADPFPYYKAFIDLNPSFESVLKNYMNTKYSVAGKSGGDYHVDVILESCTYEAVKAGAVMAHGSGGGTATIYQMKVTSEVTVKVRVNVGGKVSEREIMSGGEFTGNHTEYSTVTRSFDLAIRGAISRMDKFLDKALAEQMAGRLGISGSAARGDDVDVVLVGVGGLKSGGDGDSGVVRKVSPEFIKSGAISGGRSRASIQRVVMKNMGELRSAYNRLLRDKPGSAGKITAKFAIDEQGKIIFIQVVETTMNNAEFENIVVEAVKKWDFSPIDKPGDVTEVTYPFLFSE